MCGSKAFRQLHYSWLRCIDALVTCHCTCRLVQVSQGVPCFQHLVSAVAPCSNTVACRCSQLEHKLGVVSMAWRGRLGWTVRAQVSRAKPYLASTIARLAELHAPNTGDVTAACIEHSVWVFF